MESHWTKPGLDGDLPINRLPIRLKFDHGVLIECEDQGVGAYSYSMYLPDETEWPPKPLNDDSVEFDNPECTVEDQCAQQ